MDSVTQVACNKFSENGKMSSASIINDQYINKMKTEDMNSQ